MENIFSKNKIKDKILKEQNLEKDVIVKKNKETIKETPFTTTSFDDVLNLQQKVKQKYEDKIAGFNLENVNPFFDSELIKALDIFYNFVSNINPEVEPYYTKENDKITINYQALIDAREHLVNEFGIDPTLLRYNTADDGSVNIKKIYLKDNYTIDSAGIIKKGNDVVMNPYENPTIKIIDFKKNTLIVNPGVIVDITKNKDKIAEKLYYENPYIPNKTSPDKIIADITKDEFQEITGIDLTQDIVDSATYSEDDFSYCNWDSINFLWLMFLIVVGGGRAGVMPLAQEDKGKVSWDCKGTEGKKTEITGHPWMYTESKKIGMRSSILQTLHANLGSVFKANISWHIKILKHRIGFDLCIGGWAEYGIILMQKWFSKELCEIRCRKKESTTNGDGNKGVNLDIISKTQKQSSDPNISSL